MEYAVTIVAKTDISLVVNVKPMCSINSTLIESALVKITEPYQNLQYQSYSDLAGKAVIDDIVSGVYQLSISNTKQSVLTIQNSQTIDAEIDSPGNFFPTKIF